MTHEEIVAADLGKCAKAALPKIPACAPGLPWFEIIALAKRGQPARSMSFHNALRPLLSRGLLHRQPQPRREDGTRDFDRYWLTREGVLVRNVINRPPPA